MYVIKLGRIWLFSNYVIKRELLILKLCYEFECEQVILKYIIKLGHKIVIRKHIAFKKLLYGVNIDTTSIFTLRD